MGIATKVSKLHKSFDSLIPVQEARRILGKAMKLPIVPENISLDQAAGRMVISDFFAQESSPGFPRSAMDGYAVRSADIENASLEHPVRIRVGGDILIGEVPHRAGKDATCMKIPTGGYVPEPFDAVIPVERATLDGEDIIAIERLKPGSNIDPEGSDYRKGEVLIRKGTILRSKDIIAIASQGKQNVRVLKKIRIGIVSTGNEITPVGGHLEPGARYDSNSWGIMAALGETGQFTATNYGIAKDTRDETESLIKRVFKENDLVITTGGTSAGEKDYVYRAASDMSPGIQFHGLKVKPGMPALFALNANKGMIGLPGPSVSAMMLLYDLFMPEMLSTLGATGIPIQMKYSLARDLRLSRGRLNLVPVSLSMEARKACPLTGGSGALGRLPRANGYIALEGDVDVLREGAEVWVRPFSPLPM
ncbi:MAG: molybdopterin molybdotransferase MoeA [Candidatus Thermoplasmatota archaeon]|nr:molybdopterin molybdotransferase MoeA [Candidatus Thermoplasmatota archaeon]